jgi:hypothetical protein
MFIYTPIHRGIGLIHVYIHICMYVYMYEHILYMHLYIGGVEANALLASASVYHTGKRKNKFIKKKEKKQKKKSQNAVGKAGRGPDGSTKALMALLRP